MSRTTPLDTIQKHPRLLIWSAVYSIVVHIVTYEIVSWLSIAEEKITLPIQFFEQPRPVTTRFYVRPPALATQMRLRKRPAPRVSGLTASTDISVERSALLAGGGTGSKDLVLKAPIVAGAGLVGGGGAIRVGEQMAKVTISVDVGTVMKEPEHRIEMKEQLLDLNTLDTGRYHAMVVQDPTNKQKIRGYFHIALAYSPRMTERTVEGMKGGTGELLFYPFALPHLAEAMNQYTNIKTDFIGRISFDSRELLETPWIFIPGIAFSPTESELENLGRYLISGGFVFADDGSPHIRRLLRDALAKVGKPFQPIRLTSEHPIYHAFFDFDAPPRVDNSMSRIDYLEGVEVDGRLAIVMNFHSMAHAWNNSDILFNANTVRNNVRSLQFGVNAVVFALTQEGSITHRVMETVQ
jgi:hypothetical protein